MMWIFSALVENGRDSEERKAGSPWILESLEVCLSSVILS